MPAHASSDFCIFVHADVCWSCLGGHTLTSCCALPLRAPNTPPLASRWSTLHLSPSTSGSSSAAWQCRLLRAATNTASTSPPTSRTSSTSCASRLQDAASLMAAANTLSPFSCSRANASPKTLSVTLRNHGDLQKQCVLFVLLGATLAAPRTWSHLRPSGPTANSVTVRPPAPLDLSREPLPQSHQ